MKIDPLEVDTGELTFHEYEYMTMLKDGVADQCGPSAWMSAVYEFLKGNGYITGYGEFTERGKRAYAKYTARFAKERQT
jgi:NAD(P)H-flavin reductase